MANQQSQIVTIDGVEFKVEDMTEQQQMLLNHVADLERKIGSIMSFLRSSETAVHDVPPEAK